ncbi:myosin heavy chain, fast skeletal muscle-like isoform X4 [Atheta coriaria]|uniref:myosin heavy chain, fast skeletal muscle-like isoform X4 n=1 Tax=Dalotia coriaria TaxID=877792 RepID=UPI0031F34D7A
MMNMPSTSTKCAQNMCDPECADSSRTLGIIHEFRKLYEDKMRIIEAEGSGDCNIKAKLSLQHDWIRDLNEQNEMLVRAVEELEQEATERVIALEEKLRQSSKCACEVMNGYKDLSNAFQHVDALQEDVCTLVAFIKRSIMQRSWDLDSLSLRTVRIFDITPDVFPQTPIMENETKMQHEIALKDKNIKMLQQKLEDAMNAKMLMAAEMQKECNKCDELQKSMLDIRDALAAEVADKHDVILTLKRDVQVLEEQCKKADQQTHFKDDIIKELRKEIKLLKSEAEERTNTEFSENNEMKHLYEETIQKLCHLECEKEDLHKLLHDHKIESSRKIAALETMLIECRRAKPCASIGQQTILPQACVECETDPPPIMDKCVGDCQAPLSTTGCQTHDLRRVLSCEHETWCDCKSDSVTSLKAEETKLEEVVHGLQSSVSKMIVSECQIKQDKARISELEMQLSCAWKTRDCEVQAARQCREKEITNLKQVIDNLVKNLDNEKQRSDNLQKAVDMYHDTVDTMKESEHKFKQEVLGQKRTIQNLQEVLIKTKQNLEELQEKSNIECQEHSILVEKLITIVTAAEKEIQVYVEQCEEFAILIENLRDENIQLEENLFYNHQDLEMYEMRLSKYQGMYNQVESQCGTLKKELQALEAQKYEKDVFVQDLSEHLAECQKELADLFSVLNSEKVEKEDQTEHIAELQLQLTLTSEKLNCTLNALDREKEQSAKLSKSLVKNQNVTATIRNETILAHEKLQAAALTIASHEQKINIFSQEIIKYQSVIETLEHDQRNLNQQLEVAQLQLESRCTECDKFCQQIAELKIYHENEVKNLSDKLYDMDRTESKLKQNLIDTETKYHTQINQYLSEQERLITVVNTLEHQITHINSQLMEKERHLEVLKSNICSQELVQNKHEEIIHLKNEINTLIQTQVMLKADNEKLQMQLGHMRSSLTANDEKNKLIIAELEACLNDLHNDKDFLVRKNDQLLAKIQSLQDIFNSKTESLVTLELELTEAKFTRDSLCNESKQVIDHVKCWLEEQRKINIELNERIKHKNDVIGKLKQEKKNLIARLKQVSSSVVDSSLQKTASSNCTAYTRQQQQSQYPMQVLHSPPPPRRGWSLGSVDSAPCSLIDDSDWEADNNDEEHCPQIWIHRVECLTEELQRSNLYWKSKMTEQEYSVSRDK